LSTLGQNPQTRKEDKKNDRLRKSVSRKTLSASTEVKV